MFYRDRSNWLTVITSPEKNKHLFNQTQKILDFIARPENEKKSSDKSHVSLRRNTEEKKPLSTV